MIYIYIYILTLPSIHVQLLQHEIHIVLSKEEKPNPVNIFFNVKTHKDIGPVPVAVDGPLEELHGVLLLSETPIGRAHLRPQPADAGVALEGVGPALRLPVHHLQHVASTPLRRGQLLLMRG